MAIDAFEISTLGQKYVPLNLANAIRDKEVSKSPDLYSKKIKLKKKVSPYLRNEKIQMLSRVTEKRFVHQKSEKGEMFSSFPLAVNIYKANSDEFKGKKNKQKNKKSVLTLPNGGRGFQACTVSDMNDSDYFQPENTIKLKPKPRAPNANRRSSKLKGIEVYDRDAHYGFTESTTDFRLQKQVDEKGRAIRAETDDFASQDVWTVLRNINKFQFRPVGKISEDSLTSGKKRTNITKRTKSFGKGRRLIETCRTEEISLVANIEIERGSKVSSPSSSVGRVTVINNDISNFKALGKKIVKAITNTASKNKNLCAVQNGNRTLEKNDTKSIHYNQPWSGTHRANKNNPVKVVCNEQYHPSRSTLNGSQDSSNCYRTANSIPSISTITHKPLLHPNQIKAMLLNKPQKPGRMQPANPIPEKRQRGFSERPKAIKNITTIHEKSNYNNEDTESKTSLAKPIRIVTTMPSSTRIPNHTAAEIRKKLSQLRFPMTVMSRDQVSSTFQVIDDIPQFNGLDKHIWPFMVEWQSKPSRNRRIAPLDCINNHFRSMNEGLSVARPRDKKKHFAEPLIIMPKKKLMEPLPSPPMKPKPMRQFKDKMLKLLYKKTSPTEYGNDSKNGEAKKERVFTVDACTEMPKEDRKVIIDVAVPKNEPLMKTSTTSTTKVLPRYKPYVPSQQLIPQFKPDLSKAKWTNNNIEDVFRKLKNGAYYNTDSQNKILESTASNVMERYIQTQQNNVSKDMSIQTPPMQLSSSCIKIGNIASVNVAVSDTDATAWKVNDPLIKIPGFDDVLPALEIESVGLNQISVKNQKANVMVHFDVSVPSSQKSSATLLKDAVSTTSSCIPLSISDSQTKIYKCSTTILNAMLPAELCTVLPSIMRNMLDPNSTTTITTSRTDSNITISELSESELFTCRKPAIDQASALTTINKPFMDPYNQISHNPWMAAFYNNSRERKPKQRKIDFMIPWPETQNSCLSLNPVLRALQVGDFTNAAKRLRYWLGSSSRIVFKTLELIRRANLDYTENANQPKPIVQGLMYIVVDPRQFVISDPAPPKIYEPENKVDYEDINNVTSVALCRGQESSWIFNYFEDFTGLLQKMWNYCRFNIHFNIPQFDNRTEISMLQTLNSALTIDINRKSDQSLLKRISFTSTKQPIKLYYDRSEKELVHSHSKVRDQIRKFNLKCICDSFPEPRQQRVNMGERNIHMAKIQKKSIVEIQDAEVGTRNDSMVDIRKDNTTEQRKPKSEKPKFRKAGYLNLYKKCNNNPYTGSEKSSSTPLDKIETLDDFMQALGSRALCAVFNDEVAQKTLSCVKEMQNWINEITPCQALLILLLLNKKETHNLVQLRPVLLQGIAVNRITRAAELDMEIEVIEQEKVNMPKPQYENVTSCITICTPTNTDMNHLFDELCWIAKTTASDYQQPFDESKEKLLKSLLQKRKQLNPSYLRVMARYVGLGLLVDKGIKIRVS